jgi:hypothetical protein
LPVKFLVESGGEDFNSLGGSESLGPPDGGIILAQPVLPIMPILITMINPIAAMK